MNPKEQGFLLLTCSLGDPARKPLTVAQFRTLAGRVAQAEHPKQSRELTEQDLVALGYDRQMACRIVGLLAGGNAMTRYIQKGRLQDCFPVSRISPAYPPAVRHRLCLDAPGCLWAKGNTDLLITKAVCLVGSRNPDEPNRRFAETLGREAARQGITLVSGNARGCDRAAQDACLEAGGKVICVVADELYKHPLQNNVLYLSEDSFDAPFSACRALSRNRIIHTLGHLAFVAQCSIGTGGTWDGTLKNLRNRWSPVFCFDDGSDGTQELVHFGATPIHVEQLTDLSALQADILSFL